MNDFFTQRNIEKIRKALSKQEDEQTDSYSDYKISRILNRNIGNNQLFNLLLDEFGKNSNFIRIMINLLDEDINKFDVQTQKRIIMKAPSFLEYASEDVKNDKNFVEQMIIHAKDAPEIIERFAPGVFADLIPESVLKDKDFCLKIQNDLPLIFLKSIKYNDYTDEEINTFFTSACDIQVNDFLTSEPVHINNNLDYIFIYSDAEDIVYNSKIRNYLIKHVGEKAYFEKISQMENLQSVDIDTFKQIISLGTTIWFDFDMTLWSRDYVTSKYSSEQIELMDKILSLTTIQYRNLDTPEKVSKHLQELAQAIGKTSNYQDTLSEIHQNWEDVKAWIYSLDNYTGANLNGFQLRNNFVVLNNLLSFSQSKTIKQASTLLDSKELKSSSYVDNIQKIDINDDNIDFLRLIALTPLCSRNNQQINLYYKLFLKMTSSSGAYETISLLQEISNNSQLENILSSLPIEQMSPELISNLSSYIDSGLHHYIKISSLSELNDIRQLIQKHKDEIPTNGLTNQKNKILIGYFQLTLSKTNQLISSYFSNINDSSLYKTHPEIMYLKGILQKITNAKSLEELEEIKQLLDNKEINMDFKHIKDIEEEIKQEYGHIIKDSLTKLPPEAKIYDYSNQEFNCLIHVIGAYGSPPTGDVYESWNTKEYAENIALSCSYISDGNMGTARIKEDSVVLGFTELEDDYLKLMSSMDLYAKAQEYSALRPSKFMTPEELVQNTRHGHNEIVISRKSGKFSASKTQPSYIICFDKINEKSKETAEKFGIPIIYIDRQKVASRHYHDICNMVEEYKKTLDPSLIGKVVSMQEENRAGLRMGRPDLSEQYFNKNFRQTNIETIYQIISENLASNNPLAIKGMQEFVQSLEHEQEKFNILNEEASRKTDFEIEYEDMVETFKQDERFPQKVEIEEELELEQIVDGLKQFTTSKPEEDVEIVYTEVSPNQEITSNLSDLNIEQLKQLQETGQIHQNQDTNQSSMHL